MLGNKAIQPFLNRHIALMLIHCSHVSLMNVLTMSKIASSLGNPTLLKCHITLDDIASCIASVYLLNQCPHAINDIYRLAIV